ncbi:DNA replication factor A protein 1 [Striga asiatica]|uniref:DNA replication factor A protein 1 n=1 Tax=Striga asiatica TaxID=4170 RepID=A0A5A7P3T2_STRAF|nr:DNA replication factor A protein 1 [Striga asiatica]
MKNTMQVAQIGDNGTKVAYNNNSRESSLMLQLYKRYYPCENEQSDQLDYHIECEKFGNLHRFVDIEDLQNVQGVVAHTFELKDVGVDAVNSGQPRIEDSQLAQTINAGNVVVAMRVKVTTFHGLSLSTRAASSILINPLTPAATSSILINPLTPAATTLKHWCLQNKPAVLELIATDAYKKAAILLPPPKSEDIKTIATLLSPK